ncbi:hypothetical protein [uncultured Helicobacter sp.]|nr:hypothetical protein [uncultured Helicobacter sp.]
MGVKPPFTPFNAKGVNLAVVKLRGQNEVSLEKDALINKTKVLFIKS